MSSTPGMSKQSDGCCLVMSEGVSMSSAWKSVRKLCVMGGIFYVYSGSADYTSFTDWD